MVFFHCYTNIKVDSYNSLAIEKALTLPSAVIHIVLNKDQNHYYYNIFLEKCSYQLAQKTMEKNFLLV